MDLKYIEFEGAECIHLAWEREDGNEYLVSSNCAVFQSKDSVPLGL
jgi:hypothetical protein